MRKFKTERVFTDKDGGKDYKSRISFYIDAVDIWEEYVYEDTFKEYPGAKTYISIGDNCFICLISFEEFDALMNKERSKVDITKKNN